MVAPTLTARVDARPGGRAIERVLLQPRPPPPPASVHPVEEARVRKDVADEDAGRSMCCADRWNINVR